MLQEQRQPMFDPLRHFTDELLGGRALELLDCSHQYDVSLLDKLQQGDGTVRPPFAPGDVEHEPQAATADPPPRPLIACPTGCHFPGEPGVRTDIRDQSKLRLIEGDRVVHGKFLLLNRPMSLSGSGLRFHRCSRGRSSPSQCRNHSTAALRATGGKSWSPAYQTYFTRSPASRAL